MNHNSYIVWGGFWVAPVLFILSLPIASRAARRDGDAIGRIVLIAAGVKVFAAPLLRYWMAFSVYGGSADAARYHDAGVGLAPLLRRGIYSGLGEISGTRFLEVLTGQVYALTGPTRLGVFMVFSWFGFLGCYLFYRAFRIAYPDGDGRRYAMLVFFFPTTAVLARDHRQGSLHGPCSGCRRPRRSPARRRPVQGPHLAGARPVGGCRRAAPHGFDCRRRPGGGRADLRPARRTSPAGPSAESAGRCGPRPRATPGRVDAHRRR